MQNGHAQERSLFDEVLPTVEEDDVWIADRNFCTLKFLFGVAAHKGYFIIRQHQSMPWQATDDFWLVGQSDSGTVFEQNIVLSADDGQLLKARRIKVCLKQPNRDGDREILILTNLPSEVANAMLIAIPPEKWCVFQNITFIELSQLLKHLAGHVKLRAFRRHPRGLKKPQPKRTYLKNRPHVSTFKILNQKKLENNTP
ncbi:hypothetical protein [Nostoc sp. GT001]|uniref:hypothetical protein n=1 Tax=Nostoc sp. GT001 TaxID=3056647 RepID=UPI000DFADAFA|nr:hypothetical protein [Nostoc sp. GT001]MDM9580454.1 hypothetical protein [Nostoc sp. GT001]RCJ21272.1 hypothetical protein A6S26_24595 [Nostoc sp. ATCC 43529]